MENVLCRTLKKQNIDSIPIWFMRQAGRYLPEYRQIRQGFDHFLDFCFSPQEACEVTLQPLRRFDLDAAILFSDILVIPHALGQKVSFIEKKGPCLEPIPINQLRHDAQKLDPVFETIVRVKKELGKDKALIGFCGAPWTVATYMIEGQSSKTYQKTKTFAYQNPTLFVQLLHQIADASADYLIQQIEAGVDTIKIFDSWASAVPEACFDDWVIQPTKYLIDQVKKRYPHIPVMGFPRGAGVHYSAYLHTDVDCVTIDDMLPKTWAHQHLSPHVVLQGGLDPMVVVAGGDLLDKHVDRLLETFKDVSYIFNLGHGFVPETPIDHIERVIQRVRNFEASCR